MFPPLVNKLADLSESHKAVGEGGSIPFSVDSMGIDQRDVPSLRSWLRVNWRSAR